MGRRMFGVAAVLGAGLAVAACSSSSSSSTTTSTTIATTTTTTTAPTSSTTAPSTQGAATPQDVANAFLAATQSKDFLAFCALAVPSEAATCKQTLSSASASQVVFKNLAVGTVTVQGDKAIAVFTGSICDPTGTKCQTNTDPNAALANGTSFDKAYAAALNTSSGNSSAFASALVQQGGRWYATGF